MKVFIPAAGRGTRITPYSEIIPKPLLPVAGVPCIYRIVTELLEVFNEEDITVVVRDKDKPAFVHALREFDVNIIGVRKPMGNMYDIRNMIGDEDFMIRMADELTEINYYDFIATHENSNADATIAVTQRAKHPLGLVEIKRNQVTKFVEKPEALGWFFVVGAIFKPQAKTYVKLGYHAGHVLREMIKDGRKVIAFKLSSEWVDIGTIEGWRRANEIFKHQ